MTPSRTALGQAVSLFLVLALAWPAAHAEDDAAASAVRARIERIRALRQQRPGDGLLAWWQAIAHASVGEREAALTELRSLAGRRLGLVPAPGLGFDPLWSDPEFQSLRETLAAQEPATANAPEAFRLDDPRLVPEGIAYDPTRRRWFVGSVARHKIVVRDTRGRIRDFSQPEDRLDAVLGLAVDPRRRALFAVSTNGVEDSAKAGRRNAVLRYDLGNGRLASRYEAPDALQLNDVAVALDGTLYATDSEAGSVYRMRPGERGLAVFGKARGAPGANGIAVAPDGAIYVTLTTGIGRIDPADGSLQRLAQPDSVVTGGMDGLYWDEGDLVGVQNGTNPGRVIRIDLVDGGRRIAGIVVLQSHHHPSFAEPTTGAIVNGTLQVLANTYVGRLRPDGSIADASTLAPTVVVAVPLGRKPAGARR